MKYRGDIDGLRAVAVLLVVAFHAFPTVVHGGFIGVDVFFVISGYLISGNILSGLRLGRFSLGDFYIRRARRILPAMTVVLAGTLAIGGWVLLLIPYKSLAFHAVAGALFVPNFAYWSEVGYFDAAAETKPLLHLWSLGVEEQFYLVWPILLMLLSKRTNRLLIVLGVIVAASLAYSCYATVFTPDAAFYSPLSRLWELGAGGLLAAVPHRTFFGNWLSGLGLALICGGALLIEKTSPFPGMLAMVPVCGALLVVASSSRLLQARPMQLIGRISYPLYLWHWPLLSFAVLAGLTGVAPRLAILVASMILAWLTYRLIETPIRFGRLNRSGVGWTVSALTLVACFSAFAYAKGGIPGRFPWDIRPVLALMEYPPGVNARAPQCWLSANAPFDAYGAECRIGSTLIWGDSHAARLYSGFGPGGDVAQFTRDGCLPSLTTARSACDLSNAAIIDEIARLKPQRVIVFSAWLNHGDDWRLDDLRTTVVRAALRQIKISVAEVVLLGSGPYWSPDLPTAVFRYYTNNKDLPDRLEPTRRGYSQVNLVLSTIAAEEGVRFISVFDSLCNENGCLTHTPASKSDLLSWDYGHLTTSGAAYVVQTLHLN